MAALQINAGPQPQKSTGHRDRQKDQYRSRALPQEPQSGREDKYIKTNELGDGIEVAVGCPERRAANYRFFSPPQVKAGLLRAKARSVYLLQSSKPNFLSNAPEFIFPIKSWSLGLNAARLRNLTAPGP